MDELSIFNPDSIGIANGNYFGLPCSLNDSEIVIIPVPWDVTTSYRAGTSKGPEAIAAASLQVDLFDCNIPEAWKVRIGTLPLDKSLIKKNAEARKISSRIIAGLEKGASEEQMADKIVLVNEACDRMNQYVHDTSAKFIAMGKKVCILGGEHSVPFGNILALSEVFSEFGILHIDAHADLRKAYEGFTSSHASIMYNVLQNISQVKTICQVGQRDYCSAEDEIIRSDKRIAFFPDNSLSEMLFKGIGWNEICNRVIESLPDNVYISFDIDGLSPDLCPGTGTPVPGGMSFREADYLLYKLASSGKRIIGFDLCEVAPGNDEWDANVGARLLYKLCLYLHLSCHNA